MSRRAPSGYLYCTAPGCVALGTFWGRCGWHRQDPQPQLALDLEDTDG